MARAVRARAFILFAASSSNGYMLYLWLEHLNFTTQLTGVDMLVSLDVKFRVIRFCTGSCRVEGNSNRFVCEVWHATNRHQPRHSDGREAVV